MNVDQHLKVAQWHVEQARLHATGDHACGCPVSADHQRAIDDVEALLRGERAIESEQSCAVK